MPERGPNTGRFLTGNKVAAGNSGNRKSKWGNRNAVKHGFFSRIMPPHVGRDGWLHIYHANIRISPSAFYIANNAIYIRQDILDILKEKGLC